MFLHVDFLCRSSYRDRLRLAIAEAANEAEQYDALAARLEEALEAMIVTTEIKRSAVCKLIEPEKVIPAVYECEPLLSQDEEAGLVTA
jgi:hypothetical protein